MVQHSTAQLTTPHHLISIYNLVILLYDYTTILQWWYCGMVWCGVVSIHYLIISPKFDTLHPLGCGGAKCKHHTTPHHTLSLQYMYI